MVIDKIKEIVTGEPQGAPPEGIAVVPADGEPHLEGVSAPPVFAPDAVAPADAGTPDGEITPQARAELDKLKARNEAAPSPTATKAKKSARASAPSNVEASATASETQPTDGVPVEIPGLTSSPDSAGQSAYEKRQAELKAAREKGRKPKMTEKQRAAEAAKKAREKEKAKADKEKAKAKEKTEKQKAAEASRKAKDKEKQAERAKAEKERKDKLAKERAERAAVRAAKATPDLLKKEPKAVQELFAQQYKQAAVDKIRRPKCDRGDFAAGWMTLLRSLRKEGKGQLPTADGATKERNQPVPAAAKA